MNPKMLQIVGSFNLGRGVALHIVRGSVVDFVPPMHSLSTGPTTTAAATVVAAPEAEGGVATDITTTTPKKRRAGAIVNAANEEMLGGGGVDGAISHAGGTTLFNDRKSIPKVARGVRCRTGDAVITGPNKYGKLHVPFVIHAVGPDYCRYDNGMITTKTTITTTKRRGRKNSFDNDNDVVGDDNEDNNNYDGDDDNDDRNNGKDWNDDNDYNNNSDDDEYFTIPDGLLRSAYQASLDRCHENDITDVAFSLLSAGVYRGDRDVLSILSIGVAAIRDWVNDNLDTEEEENEDEDGKEGQGGRTRSRLLSVTLCGFSPTETASLMSACQKEIPNNNNNGSNEVES